MADDLKETNEILQRMLNTPPEDQDTTSKKAAASRDQKRDDASDKTPKPSAWALADTLHVPGRREDLPGGNRPS